MSLAADDATEAMGLTVSRYDRLFRVRARHHVNSGTTTAKKPNNAVKKIQIEASKMPLATVMPDMSLHDGRGTCEGDDQRPRSRCDLLGPPLRTPAVPLPFDREPFADALADPFAFPLGNGEQDVREQPTVGRAHVQAEVERDQVPATLVLQLQAVSVPSHALPCVLTQCHDTPSLSPYAAREQAPAFPAPNVGLLLCDRVWGGGCCRCDRRRQSMGCLRARGTLPSGVAVGFSEPPQQTGTPSPREKPLAQAGER